MENTAVGIAREELVPLLDSLCRLLQAEGELEQCDFFARILGALRQVREDEDLAGAFLELSTAAFHGFVYSLPATLLIDRVLESAERLSATLAASGEAPH